MRTPTASVRFFKSAVNCTNGLLVAGNLVNASYLSTRASADLKS